VNSKNLNLFTNKSYEQEKPVHVSARFSGELAAIWRDLETQFSDQSPSDMLKECVRVRALLAELQRRKMVGGKAEVTIFAEETNYKHEDLFEFMAMHRPIFESIDEKRSSTIS